MDTGCRTRLDEMRAKKKYAVSRTRNFYRTGYTEHVYTVCELSVGGCLITGMHFVVLFPPPRKVVQARVEVVGEKVLEC
jgi:hypothetical protein